MESETSDIKMIDRGQVEKLIAPALKEIMRCQSPIVKFFDEPVEQVPPSCVTSSADVLSNSTLLGVATGIDTDGKRATFFLTIEQLSKLVAQELAAHEEPPKQLVPVVSCAPVLTAHKGKVFAVLFQGYVAHFD